MRYLIFAGFMIVILLSFPMQVGAVASYDAGTNTIYLGLGNNTLSSLFTDINDPLVLSNDGGSNTYTLNAHISGKNGENADLVLENATLVINSTCTPGYLIKTWSDLTISSMTIRANNPNYPWKIWAFARYTSYSVAITDSDLSGGSVLAQPNGYQTPSKPTVIKNNYFHDTTFSGLDMKNMGCVQLQFNAENNAEIYNNTFENVDVTGPLNPHAGILHLGSGNECKVEKTFFYNCSVRPYDPNAPQNAGAIDFYGSAASTGVITGFEIRDLVGTGLDGKEYGNIIFSSGTIKNTTRAGIRFYKSNNYVEGMIWHVNYWVWNVTIDSTPVGIESGAFSTNDIYNVRINNVDTAYYHATYEAPSTWYITNSKATNYKTLHKTIMDTVEFRQYELADISVVDVNGNPVSEAMIKITSNSDIPIFSINRIMQQLDENTSAMQSLTQTKTLTNGHTALPDEDPANTVALLRLYKTISSEQSGFTYSITAEKHGIKATANVTPDESWYRSDPNDPVKTITITLPVSAEIINSIDKIIVYPNPYIKGKSAGGKIIFGNLPKESVLKIYTMSGELVEILKHEETVDGGSEEWNVSSVPSGVYLYVITSARGANRGKVCVIK